MTGLDSLYSQILADHANHSRRRGLLQAADAVQSRQLSPSCGDDVTFQFVLDGERVADAAWIGHGCMISQASASILAEQAPGLMVAELRRRIDSFRASMRSRGELPIDEELLGDAVALQGAARFPARVRCAMLAWVAAEDALAGR